MLKHLIENRQGVNIRTWCGMLAKLHKPAAMGAPVLNVRYEKTGTVADVYDAFTDTDCQMCQRNCRAAARLRSIVDAPTELTRAMRTLRPFAELQRSIVTASRALDDDMIVSIPDLPRNAVPITFGDLRRSLKTFEAIRRLPKFRGSEFAPDRYHAATYVDPTEPAPPPKPQKIMPGLLRRVLARFVSEVLTLHIPLNAEHSGVFTVLERGCEYQITITMVGKKQ